MAESIPASCPHCGGKYQDPEHVAYAVHNLACKLIEVHEDLCRRGHIKPAYTYRYQDAYDHAVMLTAGRVSK